MAPHLPDWLDRLCEQQHPDIPWHPPANLPRPADLRAAIADMERLLNERATPAYAKQCIAQLMVAFEPNTKLSADETRLRAMVWLEANGDLCDGLWREATQESIRSLKWMPKPSEFRDLVYPRIMAARRNIERLKEMLRAHDQPASAFKPESAEDFWRGCIERWRKFGDTVMGRDLKGQAIHAERSLAEAENRAPADWAAPTTKPQNAEAA